MLTLSRVACALALVLAAASAAASPLATATSWTGGPIRDSKGRLSMCAIEGRFNNGLILAITLNGLGCRHRTGSRNASPRARLAANPPALAS